MNPLVPDFENVCFRSGKGALAIPAFEGELTLCRVLGVLKMLVSSSDEQMMPVLAMDGCWEPHVTTALWAIIQPGMYVVNVGAHVGYYALLAGMLVGPKGIVRAFEPNPALSDILGSNIRMNNLDGRVIAPQRAVGTVPEGQLTLQATLRHTSCRPGEGSLVCDPWHEGNNLVCQSVSVVSIGPDSGRVRPDLVICDAEGSEPDVFASMRPWATPTSQGPIFVCDWDPVMFPDTCGKRAQEILDAGYKVSLIDGRGDLTTLPAEAFLGLKSQAHLVCDRQPGGPVK